MKTPSDMNKRLARKAEAIATKPLALEYRGPDDMIQAAAWRLRTDHGLDEKMLLQRWNREPREMLVSRWMKLFFAHDQRCW